MVPAITTLALAFATQAGLLQTAQGNCAPTTVLGMAPVLRDSAHVKMDSAGTTVTFFRVSTHALDMVPATMEHAHATIFGSVKTALLMHTFSLSVLVTAQDAAHV